MRFKLPLAFLTVCFSFNLFAQLTLNQKTAMIIDCTTHHNGNLWWGEKIPAENLETMKCYIADGADPNVQNADGNSPIHYAAAAGDLEFIKYLVCERLIAVDSTNLNNVTPFMTAAMFGQTEAMELLHTLGAQVNARDRYHRTALHWAVRAKAAKSIPTLWRLGANMNAIDRFGSSPLNYASSMKYNGNNVAYVLINYGAQMTLAVQTNQWWSEFSPLRNNSVITRAVRTEGRSRMPDLFLPLRISSNNHNGRPVLDTFLAHPGHRSIDINRFQNQHSAHSLLFSAVSLRNIPCVLLLLERGANPVNREYARFCSSLTLANRIPDFHWLNLLTGESFFQGIFRAALHQLYVLLAPLTRNDALFFVPHEVLRFIVITSVSLHLYEGNERL